MRNFFSTGFFQRSAKKVVFDESLNKTHNHRFQMLLHYGKKYPLYLVIFALAIFMTVIIFKGYRLLHEDTSQVIFTQKVQAKNIQSILFQLKDIDNQLQALQTSPQNSAVFKESLTKITEDLDAIKASFSAWKISMDTEMEELKKAVTTGSSQKQLVASNQLPFQLISIDVIGEQPFVSVNYQNHIIPLSVGDSLAGWQLHQADFSTATAEFKNEKEQYSQITLQGE